MKKLTTIAIDLAKKVFQVAVYNKYGNQKSNKAMNATQMMEVIHQHPEAQICMEACGSAHYWGRRFEALGHDVYLVPAHLAAQYRRGNKNDLNDVDGIYEAAKRPKTYFVSVRTLEQQDLAVQHKLRHGYVNQRTQTANRIRGFAREYGVNFSWGIHRLRHEVPDALEDADNELTPSGRSSLRELLDQLLALDRLIEAATREIKRMGKLIKACKELVKMPGIGWITATMLYVRFGSGAAFRCGRDASASIGLVPAHQGSGGYNRLGKISKRGDKYLRWLIIHGARAVINNLRDKQDGLSCWIRNQLAHKHPNNTTVALANKLVRMALAILKSGESYRAPVAQVAP